MNSLGLSFLLQNGSDVMSYQPPRPWGSAENCEVCADRTEQGCAAGANPRFHICLSCLSSSSGGKQETSEVAKTLFSHSPPPAKDPEARVTPCLCTRYCASSFDSLVNLCRGCYGNPTVKKLPLCHWDLDLALARLGSLTTSHLVWDKAQRAGSQGDYVLSPDAQTP